MKGLYRGLLSQEEGTILSLERTVFLSFREWIRDFHDLLRQNQFSCWGWRLIITFSLVSWFLHQDADGVEQNTETQFNAMFCYCQLRWFPWLKWW